MEDIEKMKIDINVIMQVTETVKTKIVLRHFAILTSSTILRSVVGLLITYSIYYCPISHTMFINLFLLCTCKEDFR